jgi:hypothetical protein
MRKLCLVFALAFLSLRGSAQNTDPIAFIVDSLLLDARDLTFQQNFSKAFEVAALAEKLSLDKIGRNTASFGNVCYRYGWMLGMKGDQKGSE